MSSMKDVAQKAGVSISTVSNVINGTRFVSEDLRIHVMKTIEKLNYEVDLVARSLKNNKTMTIGVVLTSMDRIFIPQVVSGMQYTADRLGYNLTMYTTNDHFDKEKSYIRMLVNSKVDGIIVDSVAECNDDDYYIYLENLSKRKKSIPIISLERNLSRYGICSIYVDNILGAYKATKHIIEKGCKKIIHISGPSNLDIVQYRIQGYKQALAEMNVPYIENFQIEGDFSPLSGYRAMRNALVNGIEFDGVFADNDQMAIGAIKAIKENGLEIPGKIKIVGFDNTFVSSIVKPSLTTVNVPKYRMGVESVEMLYELMNSDVSMKHNNLSRELAISLLVRESTDIKQHSNWDLEGW